MAKWLGCWDRLGHCRRLEPERQCWEMQLAAEGECRGVWEVA